MQKHKITVSSYSGFCFGVKRALKIAEKALKDKKTVYSIGPIIHNPQVVYEFSKKGLKVISDLRDIKKKHVHVLIPSHGIDGSLLKKEIIYIDTTCPLVDRLHGIVKSLRDKGYFIIIAGNKKHPEVKALKSIAGKKACVVKNKTELKKATFLKGKKNSSFKVALISQTTASLTDFEEILEEISKKGLSEFISYNTVCKNTLNRQEKARGIAKKVDAMIIIGGKNSANTTKLAEECRKVNKNTFHIESADEIKEKVIKKSKHIGIATGASTPPRAIYEVVSKIRRNER